MKAMMENPDRWYSTKEICAYLGISRETLLTWINEKDLPRSQNGAQLEI